MTHQVQFPNLGISVEVNPIAFQVGNFTIYWYGIIIGIGFLLAVLYGFSSCKKMNINKDHLLDAIIAGLLGGIIGARLYYVIFYPGDKYITNPPEDYEIPAEYLSDERFAALITEAEKYLGYPYVWGGSSPSTSFDCSGFVSYVLNQSGVASVGRSTAQGLFNMSTPVSRENAQPGDLIFFTGTYSAGTPVTHVGIYIGNGQMIHAGDPVQYANINTSYWTEHFYAFGRISTN